MELLIGFDLIYIIVFVGYWDMDIFDGKYADIRYKRVDTELQGCGTQGRILKWRLPNKVDKSANGLGYLPVIDMASSEIPE